MEGCGWPKCSGPPPIQLKAGTGGAGRGSTTCNTLLLSSASRGAVALPAGTGWLFALPVFSRGGVTAQAFNGPKLPQGSACRHTLWKGYMETRRRYSIAEHGWKGEETVDDRKKHKKEKTPTKTAGKRHLSNKKAEHKTHDHVDMEHAKATQENYAEL